MTLARDWILTLRRLVADGLPAPVARHTRLHVADTLGIALAARADAGLLAALHQAWRGDEMAPGQGGIVLGAADSLAPPAAAFVNAALAHALDFDDIHDPARLHPTPVTLAATLAVARLPGAEGRDGQRLLQAVALGNETLCRLGLACAPDGSGPASRWFLTQLLGGFGAAVAAGWMLGLEDDALVSALGFALMQAAGSKEAGFGTGSNARAIYPAFAALSGVVAARLAASGMVAPASSLDGAAGLFALYLGQAPGPEVGQALRDASRWDALDTAIKPWPCCRLSHPYVAAALDLRRQAAGRRIERLRVGVNASAERLCVPIAQRLRPLTLADAKYSVPFVTAATLVHGEPTLERLRPALLHDPEVLALAQRIEVQPGLPDRAGHPPARLTAWTADGAVLTSHCDDLPPPSDAAVRDKFLHCAAGVHDAPGLWQQLVEGTMPGAAQLGGLAARSAV